MYIYLCATDAGAGEIDVLVKRNPSGIELQSNRTVMHHFPIEETSKSKTNATHICQL